MRSSRPEVLILASRFDLTTDILISHLRERGLSYLRLNSQDLPGLEITLDPVAGSLRVGHAEKTWLLERGCVKAVFYRRPVFFSETLPPPTDPLECLARAHWLTFFRSLMIFDDALWINHPQATYKAENKPLQLRVAHSLGFMVPNTVVTNVTGDCRKMGEKIVLKGIDTVRVRSESDEFFGYTRVLNSSKLNDLASMPAIAQEFVKAKTDLRVTVIGERVYAAEILLDGKPIELDWRLNGSAAVPKPTELPPEIEQLCIKLTKRLGLRFGAVDLAKNHDGYYFLEINPTGEWGWLDTLGLPIGESIAELIASACS